MRCAECGGVTHESLDPLETVFKGLTFTLHDVPHSVCVACDEISFLSDELDAYYDAGARAYREYNGLLAPPAFTADDKRDEGETSCSSPSVS